MPIKVKLTKKKKKTQRQVQRKRPTEVTRLGAALRSLGGLGGGAIGGLIGMPAAGSGVGTSLGAALSKWLGSGDYTVGSNSIVQRAVKGSDSVPYMHNSGQTVVIRHKEFIGEILGSTGFVVRDSFILNPGNSRTFPWLSSIATGFQEYRFKGVVFHYVPSSGNAVSATNAALGTVMMQTSYRANDNPPASKVELLNEFWSSEAVPSEPFCHPIECDPKENPFNVMYVRSGEIPGVDSQLLYDLGTTHVCVSGQQASNNVLGDLWVTYEVELKKPIVSSNVTPRTQIYSAEWVGGTVTGSNWFNGALVEAPNSSLNVTATGRVVTFPKGAVGTWLIVACLSANTSFTAVDLSGGPVLTNCSQGNVFVAQSYVRTVLGGGTPTVNRAYYMTVVTISDPAVVATVTFPSATLTGASAQSDLLISPGISQSP